MPLTFVLSVGADFSVLKGREIILQSAGYLVDSVLSVEEAATRFLAGDFDLVILCRSIPTKEKGRLISLIRASGSHTPIISIAGDIGQCDTFANAMFEDDPHKLITRIKDVLAKAAMRAGWDVTCRDKDEEPSVSGKKPPQRSSDHRRRRQNSEAASQPR